MSFDDMQNEQQQREKRVERLARELGRLIRSAEPATQEELRDAASVVMRQEARGMPEGEQLPRRRPVNILSAGLGVLVVGAALAVVLPPVGLTLALCGLMALIWGAIITWIKT
jgi:hypothetical protein